jgi:hypothetical protein
MGSLDLIPERCYNLFTVFDDTILGGDSMPDYQQLYFQLFAAAADAVEAIEKANYGQAKEVLISAQQKAEEQCLDGE